MAVKVKDSGRYELFEDSHGHRFLVLNAERWFVWIEGQKSPIIVRTHPGHEKTRVLQRGKFLFVDFRNDPGFRDVPHLFLQSGNVYREFILPNGLPTDRDPQKRFVVTRKTLPVKELEDYLKHPASARRAA
jgi:hypothetical protein